MQLEWFSILYRVLGTDRDVVKLFSFFPLLFTSSLAQLGLSIMSSFTHLDTNTTWHDHDCGLTTDAFGASQEGIIHIVYSIEYTDDSPSGNPEPVPAKVSIIPVQDGLAPHPSWGWLAIKGNSVVAFRHRSAARRWINS